MAITTALLHGVAASSALIVGGVVGAYWRPSERLVAGALALSSGALLTAIAFDLFEPAFQLGGPLLAGGGLLVGAAVFTGIELWLEANYSGGNSGLALLANVTLDGIPENLALGIALVHGGAGAGAIAIFAAIFLSNVPEAIGGSKDMTDQGYSRPKAVGIWTIAAVLLVAAVVAGNTVFAQAGNTVIAVARAFAGGAVLAGVADEVLPDAYESGGPVIALATAAGFVVTFLLK